MEDGAPDGGIVLITSGVPSEEENSDDAPDDSTTKGQDEAGKGNEGQGESAESQSAQGNEGQDAEGDRQAGDPDASAGIKSTSSSTTNPADLQYEDGDSGEITITGLKNTSLTVLSIPSTIDGKRVTKIATYAFQNCDSLTAVSIPGSVTELGWHAFAGCDSLRSATLPASLGAADNAFSGSALASATIAEGAEKVPRGMFAGYASLTSVSIPGTVTWIDGYAFDGTPNLKNLSVPAGVTYINPNAFNGGAVTLYCAPNTYPVIFAIEHDMPFVITNALGDDSMLAIDRSSSSYIANLDAMTANGCVSVTATYGIKQDWADSATPTGVKIRLPKGFEFYDGSLTLDGTPITDYSLSSDGRDLRVPVSNPTGVIKYQARVTSQEDFTSYAYLQMRKNGEDTFEVIGIINEPMSALTINAPSVVGENVFEVSGIAPARATVRILLGDEEVGSATSSRAGSWKAQVTLPDPQSYRTYTLRAVCGTESGELEQAVNVTYEQDAVVMNKFTLSYDEHGMQKTCDLLNSTTKPIVYYAPSQEFTFEVGYTHPEQIGTIYVTSTRNNQKKYMEAEYDESRNAFVASGFFDPNDHKYVPGVLSVEYTKAQEEVVATEDFDWDSYSAYIPQTTGAQPTVTRNSDGQYETVIDLADYYPDAIEDSARVAVAMSDWKSEEDVSDTFSDWLDIVDTNDTILSYIVPGYDDEKLQFFVDHSREDQTLMLIKDLSENKYIELVLKKVQSGTQSANTWTTIEAVSKGLSVVNTVADVMLKQRGINEDTQKLRQEIYSLGLSPADETEALRKADELARDRHDFVVLSACIPLLMLAAGLTGPAALLLTGMLGIMTTSSEFFWQMRTAQIKGESFRLNWIIDPSGSVFDAVTKQPLEGVTATAYWIESDGTPTFFDNKPAPNEYGEVWDASEYDQVNPLQTNSDGKYAWNVPEGWWRVKYEKEGYETQWSEWMTVPPIQTGVDAYMRDPSKLIDLSGAKIASIKGRGYDGKPYEPKPKVTVDGVTLVEGTDYTLSYKNNVSASNGNPATLTVTGIGAYTGTATASFEVWKNGQPMDAWKVDRQAPAASLKSRDVTVEPPIHVAHAVSAAKPMEYRKMGGDSRLSVDLYTGRVTVRKGTPAGTYKVTIRAIAFGGSNYADGSRTVDCQVKVVSSKLDQSMEVTVADVTRTAASLASADYLTRPFSVAMAAGSVTYKKASGSGCLDVDTMGRLKVAKGTKAGTYYVKVWATAAGDAGYNACTRTVTVKVVVK